MVKGYQEDEVEVEVGGGKMDKFNLKGDHQEPYLDDREACCGCEDPLWDGWTPTLYYFPHTSWNRGCLCMWLFGDAPYIAFKVAFKKVRRCVFCVENPNIVVLFLLTCLLLLIMFPITFIFFGAFFGGLAIGSVMYCVGCCWDVCCITFAGLGGQGMDNPSWRSFNCRGWIQPEPVPGRDPYTDDLWTEWSPFADCFDYDFPHVSSSLEPTATLKV